MKKFVLLFFTIIFSFCFLQSDTVCVAKKEEQPLLSIVIDDFGQARKGVDEMIALDCPLTCAVMPGLDFSVKDAENVFKKGHEVILHMPMEACCSLPKSWYGPKVIWNSDTPKQAREKLTECFSLIPHAVGMNIHIGSGVCLNRTLMKEILSCAKENDRFFLDSKTHEKSVCAEVAKQVGSKFVERNVFLENTHNPNYNHACQELLRAAKIAKEKGFAVAIGHVGSEGGITTVNAIRDTVSEIEKMGVKLVHLSKVVEKAN